MNAQLGRFFFSPNFPNTLVGTIPLINVKLLLPVALGISMNICLGQGMFRKNLAAPASD